MSSFSIKVEGEKELQAQLLRFLGASERQAKAEIVNAGEAIRTRAKQTVPVKDGALRNSITRLLEDSGLTVTVGSNIEYAPFIEYGTRKMEQAHGQHDPEAPVTDWAAKRERQATGQQMPFLTPAFLEERKKFIKALEKAIGKEVRKRK